MIFLLLLFIITTNTQAADRELDGWEVDFSSLSAALGAAPEVKQCRFCAFLYMERKQLTVHLQEEHPKNSTGPNRRKHIVEPADVAAFHKERVALLKNRFGPKQCPMVACEFMYESREEWLEHQKIHTSNADPKKRKKSKQRVSETIDHDNQLQEQEQEFDEELGFVIETLSASGNPVSSPEALLALLEIADNL